MMQIRVALAVVLTLLCGSAIALLHFNDQVNWQSYFAKTNLIGDNCEYAVGKWPGEFATAFATPQNFTPFAMPHRGKANPPRAYVGEYLHTRCTINLAPNELTYVGLGRLIGESAIFLNDNLTYVYPDKTEAYFPLPANYQGRPVTIGILSIGTSKGNVGLGTLIPPFYTAEISDFKLIQRYLTSIYSEQTMLRLGLALSVVFLLGILWNLGRRYDDLSWVICFAAMIALMNLLRFSEQFNFSFYAFSRRLFSLTFFAAIYFELLFAIAFLRVGQWSKKIITIVHSSMALIAILVLTVPQTWFFELRLLTIAPAAVGSVAFALVASDLWLKYRNSSSIHTLLAQRMRTIIWLLGLSATILGLQAWLDEKHGVYIESTVQMSLLIMIGFVAVKDLFFREKDLANEKSLRVMSEKSAIAAKAIASTVQFIAHDIKRPLHLIATKIAAADNELQSLIQDTESLIKDLLLVSPDDKVRLEAIELRTVIQSAITTAGVPLHPDIQLKTDLDDLTVIANPKLLKRTLCNILVNAIEASQGQCQLYIFATAVDEYVKIVISNTNSEIPDEVIDQVFDPHITFGKAKGSGLGLTFCKLAIEKLGGSISVESGNMQTEFSIFLPLHENVDDSGGKKCYNPPARICVIDDDIFVADLWRQDETFGKATIYDNPDKFLAALRSAPEIINNFDAFVIDLYFKNSFTNGEKIASEIRRRDFKGLIILASHSTATSNNDSLFDLKLGKGPKAIYQYFS